MNPHDKNQRDVKSLLAALNDLSGRTEGRDENGEPIRCPEGKPGRYAAWSSQESL